MNIKNLLLEAVSKNEMIEFLEGKNGYRVNVSQFVPLNVPTDWTQIIPIGIYSAFLEKPKLKLDEMYEDAIIRMLEGDVFDIYVALSITHFQLLEEQSQTSPFRMNKDKILKKLREVIKVNEEYLRNYFEWSGAVYKDGMWGEVNRIDYLWREYLGISIL